MCRCSYCTLHLGLHSCVPQSMLNALGGGTRAKVFLLLFTSRNPQKLQEKLLSFHHTKNEKSPWFVSAQKKHQTYQLLHWELFYCFFIWGILNSPKLKIPYVYKLLDKRSLPVKLIFITCIETGKWNWIKGTVQSNIKEYRISKWSST